MKVIGKSSEPEMVLAYLQAEIDSDRFGPRLKSLLKKHQATKADIVDDDLNNYQKNTLRRTLLSQLRGFGKNKQLFEGFPTKIDWYKATISRDELLNLKYIDYSYWNELSDGTRLVKKAAENLKSGKVVFDQPNDRFFAVEKLIKNKCQFPPPILVTSSQAEVPVILEGHLRLTAYALNPSLIPRNLTVIMGIAPDFAKWPLY